MDLFPFAQDYQIHVIYEYQQSFLIGTSGVCKCGNNDACDSTASNICIHFPNYIIQVLLVHANVESQTLVLVLQILVKK